jgi:ribosomal protein S12 methylthiotransferase accessory factor
VRDGAEVHVLAQSVYALSSLAPQDARRPYTNASTSGVAAYTDIETARTRALVELIERDAFARTWLAKRAPPRLDEKRMGEPIRRRLAALREAGYDAVPLSLASEHLPVAAIFIQSSRRAFTAVTTAAGFSWDEALDSALSETESRVQKHHGMPDHPAMQPSEITQADRHGDYYRTPKGHKLADWLQSSGAIATCDRSRFAVDGVSLLNHFADRGAEVYFCDLTPPLSSLDQGRRPLHVVRAFVPGLIPIWFGYGVEPAGMVDAAFSDYARGGWPAKSPVPIHPCT